METRMGHSSSEEETPKIILSDQAQVQEAVSQVNTPVKEQKREREREFASPGNVTQ